MNRCQRCGTFSSWQRCPRCGADPDPVTRPLALPPTGSYPTPPVVAMTMPGTGRAAGRSVVVAIGVLALLVAVLAVGVVRPDLVGLHGGPLIAAAGEAPPGGSVETVPAAVQPAASTPSDQSTDDPEAALRQQAAADRGALSTIAGGWVPQLSSKRPGTVDGGRTYDAAAILAEHAALRAEYPQARLLWSGTWSSFSSDDYWVTVLADPSTTAAGANGWCDAQGLGADDCFAKRLMTTGGSDGTAVHR